MKTSLESIWEVLNFVGMSEMTMVEEPESKESLLDSDFGLKVKRLDEWKNRLLSVHERSTEFNVKGHQEPKEFRILGDQISARFPPEKVREILNLYYSKAVEKMDALDMLISNYDNLVARIDELNDAIAIFNNI